MILIVSFLSLRLPRIQDLEPPTTSNTRSLANPGVPSDEVKMAAQKVRVSRSAFVDTTSGLVANNILIMSSKKVESSVGKSFSLIGRIRLTEGLEG